MSEILRRYTNDRGYVWLYLTGQRKMAEHRYVMEKLLGRELLSSEHVHHKDRNRANNDPSNLEVMTAEEHVRLHHPEEPLEEVPCSACGKTVTKRRAHLKVGRKKGREQFFCDRACSAKGQWARGKASPKPPKEEVDLTCATCGVSFRREAHRIRSKQKEGQLAFYCGRACIRR